MERKCLQAIMASSLLLVVIVGSTQPVFSQQGIINTFAGGGPNSTVASSADIDPWSVAVDASGNIFIAATWLDEVFKADPAGNFTLVAGTGVQGFSGDGGPAANASLSVPSGVAVDTHGNLFIADSGNGRVRRVDAVTGVITTVAGSASELPGFSGNGGPATSAVMNGPGSVAVDAQGDLFIVDGGNQRVRRVDAATGIITTVAGSGVPNAAGQVAGGFSGNGGPATSARLAEPWGVALDAHGNLFIADTGNFRIRRVDAASGIITTVAGNGSSAFSGDGGPATSAGLVEPFGVVVDAQGNLFVGNVTRVRRVDAATQTITTVAGDGNFVFSGNGGPATSASIFSIGVAVDTQDDVFIADKGSGRIRRVDGTSGIIDTVVGGGNGGDGGAATSAVLIYPTGAAADSSGNLFIADQFNFRVRRADAATGIITTLAGNGVQGISGDSGPAASASLYAPNAVAVDTQGNVFIADVSYSVIRRVDVATGIITTVAGNGTPGFSGDGGPATSASMFAPYGVAVDAHENLFIADFENQRVRRVDGVSGTITTVAGNGQSGFSGNGGPATSAQLFQPDGVAVDAHGNLFIADGNNFRIRRVDAVSGIITTVAGDGDFGDSGDGGPATAAGIRQPYGVAVDALGNLFISAGPEVRRVDAVTGIITTVAGTITAPSFFSGDGGPATSAGLRSWGLAVDAQGSLFSVESANNRVRVVPLPPFVAISPASLSFSTQPPGATSKDQTITLTNTGLVPLAISGITIAGTNAGDYAQVNACGNSLAAGANCAINVTYTPSAAGSSTATLNVTDSAPGSPQSVPLSGAGQAPDFSLVVTGSASSATVTAGGTATYNLSITPLAGLSGTVGLTCSGAPAQATCTVNPASLNLSGTASVPVAVTVSTTARSAVWMISKPRIEPWIWVCWLGMLSALSLVTICKHRLGRQRAWALLGVATLGLALCAACGGGGGSAQAVTGTPAGTYTLTVAASMASGTTTLQHSVALTLTVN